MLSGCSSSPRPMPPRSAPPSIRRESGKQAGLPEELSHPHALRHAAGYSLINSDVDVAVGSGDEQRQDKQRTRLSQEASDPGGRITPNGHT
jgi:integrase